MKTSKTMSGAAMLSIFVVGCGVALLFYAVLSCTYTPHNFTAEVRSIDFYGRTAGLTYGIDKAIVKFSDGSVYNADEIPDDLKEGHTYQMQHRSYFDGGKRLVIIEEVE